MLETIINVHADSAMLAVASVAKKRAGRRATLHAGRSLVDKFAFASIGQFAVATAQFDLSVSFPRPNGAGTATPGYREWLALARKLD